MYLSCCSYVCIIRKIKVLNESQFNDFCAFESTFPVSVFQILINLTIMVRASIFIIYIRLKHMLILSLYGTAAGSKYDEYGFDTRKKFTVILLVVTYLKPTSQRPYCVLLTELSLVLGTQVCRIRSTFYNKILTFL